MSVAAWKKRQRKIFESVKAPKHPMAPHAPVAPPTWAELVEHVQDLQIQEYAVPKSFLDDDGSESEHGDNGDDEADSVDEGSDASGTGTGTDGTGTGTDDDHDDLEEEERLMKELQKDMWIVYKLKYDVDTAGQ